MPGTKGKEGPKTSEFWVSIAIIVSATILMALGSISEALWGDITKFVGGAYVVSRGLAKI